MTRRDVAIFILGAAIGFAAVRFARAGDWVDAVNAVVLPLGAFRLGKVGSR